MISRRSLIGSSGVPFVQWAQRKVESGILPLWFRFNEQSGTTIINHGSLGATVNGTLYLGAGKLAVDGLTGSGNALSLDGKDTVIEVPQNSVMNSSKTTIAILMKMRTAGEANNGYILALGRGALASMALNTFGVVISTADTASTDASTTTSQGIPATWVWLFRTYDDTGDRKVKIYIGNSSGLTELTNTTQIAATGTLRALSTNLIIGGNTISPVRASDGLFDEILLFTKILTDTEMKEIIAGCPFKRTIDDFFVDNFGAVGDGNTDDILAINKAITAASVSGGGNIRFTRGKNYAISSPIEITTGNIKIWGYGATITMKEATDKGDTVTIYGPSISSCLQGIEVYGITIDANYALAGGYQKRGLRIEYAENALVKDVTVKKAFVSLHFGTGTSDCEARDCNCIEYYNDGFDAGGTAAIDTEEPTNITFRNCHAYNAQTGADHAWEIEDGANNIHVIDSTAEGPIAVRNHDGVYAKTHDIFFENVTAANFVLENAYNTDTNYVKDIRLKNCTGEVSTAGTIEGLVIE